MRRRTSRTRATLNRKLISFAVASCFAAELAHANPTGPAVAAGTASFNNAGSVLTVTNSPNAIINWRGFSIGASEITRFQQPGASSAVLNRVVGQDPSAILGTLSSNGKVFLINPNGILFGQGSRIDVAGLVASTLNISDSDFLGGKLNFKAGAVANSIVNQGELRSSSGGNIYLIAPDVTNSGLISSPSGEVILAAGKSVSLVDAQTPNLKVEVSASEGQARNIGQIVADSGRIGVYAGLINQQGTVRADSVEVGKNGEIVFRASKDVTLASGSVTSASGAAGGAHDGGTVRVLSEGTIDMQSGSSMRAEGGSQGGNGGLLELSGKGRMQLAGSYSARALAPGSLSGSIVFDPENVDIFNGSCTVNLCIDPATGLHGGNFTVIATGDLRVLTPIVTANVDAGSSLQLDASNNLTIGAAIGSAGTRFDHDLTLRAGNNVAVNSDIYLANRTLTLAANVNALDATRTVGGSPLPGSTVAGDVIIAPTSGPVTVDTLGGLSVTGVNFTAQGGGSAFAGSGANVDRSVTVNANSINVNVSGSILVAGGDNPLARASAGGTNTAVLTTNATLNATTTLSLSAGGGITIRGGNSFDTAGAQASGGNNTATTKANALVTAGGAVTITAGTASPSTLTIAGGNSLFAKAKGTVSGSNTALTSANATVRSTGSSVALSAPGGIIAISGGNYPLAVAGLDATGPGALSGNNTATVNANAAVQAATGLTVSNTSTVTIAAGSSAKASAWKWAPGSGANITGTQTASASGNATLNAGGSLSINLTPGSLTLDGRRAIALASEEATGVTGSTMSGTNTATANSSISLTGGTSVAISLGSGSLNVNMGRADASAFKTLTGGSNVAANGTNSATANAITSVIASTGNVTVTAGGFSVNDNSANADARVIVSGGNANNIGGANNATGNATLNVAATAGDMTLTIGSAGMSVAGNSASANARHAISGTTHVVASSNTALADASITFSAGGNLTVAYPGTPSSAGQFRIDAGRGSASGYKQVSGNNHNVSGTNSATLLANVTFQAGSGGLSIRGSSVVITGGSETSPQAYHQVSGNNNIVGGNNSATSSTRILLTTSGGLTLAADAGSFSLSGGSARANAHKGVSGGPAGNTVSGINTANADASIGITGGTLTVSAANSVSLRAGNASASASHFMNGVGHGVSGDNIANANASATLSATSGALQITGTSLSVQAEGARASAARSLSSATSVGIIGDNSATANSGVSISGNSGVTISLGTGAMTVTGSGARASASKTIFSGSGNNVGGNDTANASSKVNVGAAAGSTTITVGSLMVSGSSARASAYKTANSPSTGNTLSGTHTAAADSTITLSATGTLGVATSGVGGIALSAGGFSGAMALAQDTPNGNSLSGVNSATAAASVTLSAANLNLALSNTAASFNLANGPVSVTGAGVATSKAQLLSTGAIAITGDNMNIGGSVNAGTGTVTLAPFTTSRDVNVELTPTAGVLSLSPTALGNVTAGTLVLGGTSGTLTVGSGTSVSAPNVTLIADHMSIQGTVNATAPSTGTAFLSTFSPGRNIDIRNSSGCTFTVSDPLCIGPADLQKITASTVTLMASDILYLDSAIASSDVNASTLRLVADSIYENGGGGIGSIPTPFDHHLRLEAGTNIEIFQSNIFVANNRDLSLLANQNAGAGHLLIRNVTVQAGASSPNTGQLTLQGFDITIGDPSATASTNVNTSGAMTVNAADVLSLRGSDLGTGRFAFLIANGDQIITAAGINMTAGNGGASGAGNNVLIRGNANQTVTVGSSGLTLTGGGGTQTDNAAVLYQAGTTGTSQVINVNGDGSVIVHGGSSALTNVGAGHGSFAVIRADGDSQTIAFSSGGAIDIKGGSVGSHNAASINATNGTQTIGITTGATLYPTIVVSGGDSGGFDAVGEGNSGNITANLGLQTIKAANVTINGGLGGILNSGSISAPDQDITVHGDLNLFGRDSAAGTQGAGARIGGVGGTSPTATNLTLNVDNDVTLTGGSLPGLTGSAIGSSGSAAPPLANTITMNIGRDLTLTPGSASGARIGASTANLTSGDLAITVSRDVTVNGGTSIATGGMLTLNAAGALSLIGSNGGTGQRAILSSTSTQNITATSITLDGGDAGGADLNGNFAQITSGGLQTITTTAGDLILNAGAAGINNFAAITAPAQNIIVHGNLSLTGGGSATSVDGTIGGGARIGGRGGASPEPTNLILAVDGNIHLTGGSVANAGSAIGSGAQGGQATTIALTAGGNVMLDPGTVANGGSRIGSPAAGMAGGDIAITAGGTLALNSAGPGLGTAIRTLGNLTITAGSMTEGPDSQIIAGGTTTLNGGTILLTSASNDFTGPVSLNSTGSNDVEITDANAIVLGASSVGSGPLTVIAGGAITQTGPIVQAAGAGPTTFDAGSNPITLTNAANDFTGPVDIATTSTAAITDVNSFIIKGGGGGGSNPSNFTLNANGAVTQSAAFTGSAPAVIVINAGSGPISLNNASNNFTGNASVSVNTTGAVSATNNNASGFNLGTSSVGGAMTLTSGGPVTQSGPLTVAGTSTINAGSNPITLTNASNDFSGAVNFTGSNVSLTDANAISIGNSNASGALNITATSTSFLNGLNANNYSFSGGTYSLAAGTYNLGGTTSVAQNPSTGALTVVDLQTGATINTTGGTVNVGVGGTLKGVGTIQGNVNNSGGTVAPGASPGTLTITGNYTQGASGTLDMEIGGLTAGTQYDQLVVQGSTSLAGTLNTTLVNGFVPVAGNTFTLIQSTGPLTGTFSTVNQPTGSPFSSFYGPTTFQFIAGSVSQTLPPASGSIPAPIIPVVQNVIVSTDQVLVALTTTTTTTTTSDTGLKFVPGGNIDVAPAPETTTTTADGKIVPKPPACN